MRRIRTLICLLLALLMLLPALPASLAQEPETEVSEDDERFAGKDWDQIVEEFLQSWGTDPKNVAIGYYNTVTGEEHYLNPDEYRITASMYKVPLNMVFLDRLSRGEMDWDTSVNGYRYEDVLEQTIVHSNNEIARSMIKWVLGNGNWQAGRRVMAPYCGLDPENVDWKFQENNYSTPRQMIYCLRLLYENPDRFPRLVETMQRAEPTEYFKRNERRFNIAHKYGFLQDGYHLYMNDCGIAFTDDPILLVLFTDNVAHAYDVMTEFCTLMCDYAQYRHELRLKLEAEEAERAAREAERLEQERLEQERLEAERLANEPQPSPEQTGPAAEPAPALTPETPSTAPTENAEPKESSAPKGWNLSQRAQQQGLTPTALIAAAASLLALLIAVILLAALAKKYRVRAGFFLLLAVLLCLGALGRILLPAWQNFRSGPKGDPQETVQSFFEALSRQDYAAAYGYLDHVESLGLEYVPQRESGQLLRQAMQNEFAAELYGACSVDGEQAYQQVNCRYFDVEKLDREAGSEALMIISRYVSTHSVGDLYNENGNYRPELLLDAWDQAVTELLRTPENYRSAGGVQLELRWYDGAWHIVPNDKLLQLLCGGMDLRDKGGEA